MTTRYVLSPDRLAAMRKYVVLACLSSSTCAGTDLAIDFVDTDVPEALQFVAIAWTTWDPLTDTWREDNDWRTRDAGALPNNLGMRIADILCAQAPRRFAWSGGGSGDAVDLVLVAYEIDVNHLPTDLGDR